MAVFRLRKATGGSTLRGGDSLRVAIQVAEGSGSISHGHTVVGAGDKEGLGAGSISHGHTVVGAGFKTEGDDRFGSGSITETHTVVGTGDKEGIGAGSITHGHTVVATGVKNAISDGLSDTNYWQSGGLYDNFRYASADIHKVAPTTLIAAARISLPDLTPTNNQYLVAADSTHRRLGIVVNGTILVSMLDDGVAQHTLLSDATIASVGITTDRPFWVKADWEKGVECDFYVSTDQAKLHDDVTTWIKVGTTIADTPFTAHSASDNMLLGSDSSTLWGADEAWFYGGYWKYDTDTPLLDLDISDLSTAEIAARSVDDENAITFTMLGDEWTYTRPAVIAETHTVTGTGFPLEHRSGSGAISEGHTVIGTGSKAVEGQGSLSHGHTVEATGDKTGLGSGNISHGHTVVATGFPSEAYSGSGSQRRGRNRHTQPRSHRRCLRIQGSDRNSYPCTFGLCHSIRVRG